MRRVRTVATVVIALAVLAGLATPVVALGPAADPSVQRSSGPVDDVWRLARSIYLEVLDALGWLDAGTARKGSPAGLTSIFEAQAPAIGGGNGGPIEDTAPNSPEEGTRFGEPQ